MSLLIYLFISIACKAETDEPIVPTNETTTGQYYWASLDTEGQAIKFSLGDIICATNKDCYVYCDYINGCQWTHIDARNANNLYLFCSTNSACYLMDVFGTQSSQSSVNIYCSADKACETVTFALNSSSTVNILCDSGGSSAGTGACNSAKIYTTNNQNINITCGAYDCNEVKLWAAPLSYHAFLTCIGSQSCNNTEITCVNGNGKSLLTYGSNEWQCSLDYCCPIVSTTPIICAPTPYCTTNCSNDNCISTYIHGASVSSLMSVYCNGDSDCKYSKVICPTNGECNVECNGFESCQYAVIDASVSTSLSLRCGRSGCEGVHVFCPAGDSKCSIECLGMEYSCNAMHIIQLTDTLNSYLSITCPSASFTGACTNIRFECIALAGTGEQIYYNPPNQCTQELCCPWSVETPSFSPTKSPSLSPVIQSTPTISPSNINDKDSSNGNGILNGDDEKQLFYITIILGLVVLILCVCVWGIIWFRKNKRNDKYGTNDSNVRNSKSSKNNNYNENVNISTSDVNVHKSLTARMPSTQTHLEIEKSLELQSTTQQTITEYNPSRKTGGAASTTSNPPQNTQQLGLADLGNSGWDD